MFYLPHNPCVAFGSVNEPLGIDEQEGRGLVYWKYLYM